MVDLLIANWELKLLQIKVWRLQRSIKEVENDVQKVQEMLRAGTSTEPL